MKVKGVFEASSNLTKILEASNQPMAFYIMVLGFDPDEDSVCVFDELIDMDDVSNEYLEWVYSLDVEDFKIDFDPFFRVPIIYIRVQFDGSLTDPNYHIEHPPFYKRIGLSEVSKL